MNVAAYNNAQVFEQLKPEWNALLDQMGGNVFSTWEWQSIWWNVYEPGELWVVTCRDGDRLVGIAPCFIADINDERVLSFIGCVDVTDYLDFIIAPEMVDQVLGEFARFFALNQSHFDRLDLCNLPDSSLALSRLPALLEKSDFVVEHTQLDVCPGFEVPESWEAYLGLLHKKQRHELRRKMRRAYGANVEMDWYIVGPDHDLTAEINTFVDLMAASDMEKEAFLQDERNMMFFREIVPVLYHNGWLQLAILTINNQPSAAYLNIVYRNQIMVYNSGLLRGGDYDHLSGGIILLAHLIRYAIDHQYALFDFLRGNETYKYHMGGKDSSVYALRARSHVHVDRLEEVS